MRGFLVCSIILALAGAVLLPLSSAETTAAQASGYVYPVKLEDPAGDAGLVTPTGTENPENDILSVEMTDDASTVVIRVTMATLTFTAPQGNCVLTMQMTGPAGEAWEATAVYESGGANLVFGADYSSGGAGDPDVPVPGLRGEAVPAEHAIYYFLDNAKTGAKLGGHLSVDSTSMGRGAVLFSLNGVDSVDGTIDYVLTGAAAGAAPGSGGGPAPGAGSVVHGNLTGAQASVNATFTNATSATNRYSWTTSLSAASLNYTVVRRGGSLDITVSDGANKTVANATVAGNASRTVLIAAATPGNWSIQVVYHNFTGQFALRLGAPPVPVSSSHSSSSVSSSATGPSTGGFPLRKEPKQAPGAGLVALVAALAVSALLVRRRLNG